MKFNWATGLTIFFIIFIGTLIFIVYQSSKVHDSLVVQNYYDEDINYQVHYDKKQNTANLPVKVKTEYDNVSKMVIITFPADSISDITGQILFFNPFSEYSDVKYDFDLGKDNVYRIPTDKVKAGRWRLKIDWKRGNTSYYQEEELII